MSQGVHPAEWIYPIVGAAHTAYNMTAQAVDQPDAKFTTPGSKQDREDEANERQANIEHGQRQVLGEQERQRLEAMPTAAKEFESRKRARASQTLSGARRSATDTLTATGASLGV